MSNISFKISIVLGTCVGRTLGLEEILALDFELVLFLILLLLLLLLFHFGSKLTVVHNIEYLSHEFN